MRMENKVQGLLGVSIDKIREMVDVSTVIGDPMTLEDGTTLIPVSRVTYGFASGGSDLPTKGNQELFGGGGGAGINIIPIAFLVVSDGNVRVLPLVASPDTFNQMVSMVPDVVNKIGDFFSKRKDKKSEK
ncbi:MAG: sporulation protein YtfJ [Clostridia bacterium]|nr:sporulation protein YtfJ [Clostridia bacterium]